MIYAYKCRDCGENMDLIQSMSEDTPKTVKCSKCGKDAPRDWGAGSSVIIPESFKAMSDITNADDLSNMSVLGPRLNRRRFSGKEKIFY